VGQYAVYVCIQILDAETTSINSVVTTVEWRNMIGRAGRLSVESSV
jgi:hypothetical protein